MEQRYIKKNGIEKKGNHETIPSDIRMIEADIVKPKEANVDNLMGNLEEHNTQKGHIPVLIFLVIGMVLQLTANAFCVLAGILVCVSVCGLICIWVCVSAVFSHTESDSLSGTPEFLE